MELIKKTMNVADANGWYLLQNEVRTWMEDFTDEDSGNVVSMERSEILCGKGTQLTALDISTLEENGIKTVRVSNIALKGNQEKSLELWETTIKQRSNRGVSKKTYMVTADSPANAEKYLSEWCELNVDAVFEFTKVNKQDYNKVIKMYDTERDNYEADGNHRVKWYKCQIYAVFSDDSEDGNAGSKNILCQATSFENAIEAIKMVLGNDEYDSIYNTFKLVQEQKIEEVFIPEEQVSYYSNEEISLN